MEILLLIYRFNFTVFHLPDAICFVLQNTNHITSFLCSFRFFIILIGHKSKKVKWWMFSMFPNCSWSFGHNFMVSWWIFIFLGSFDSFDQGESNGIKIEHFWLEFTEIRQFEKNMIFWSNFLGANLIVAKKQKNPQKIWRYFFLEVHTWKIKYYPQPVIPWKRKSAKWDCHEEGAESNFPPRDVIFHPVCAPKRGVLRF